MLWWKAFHVIAIISWFAGLFYLPRLFVYHADANDSISIERFTVMERRLYYGSMNACSTCCDHLWLDDCQLCFAVLYAAKLVSLEIGFCSDSLGFSFILRPSIKKIRRRKKPTH